MDDFDARFNRYIRIWIISSVILVVLIVTICVVFDGTGNKTLDYQYCPHCGAKIEKQID